MILLDYFVRLPSLAAYTAYDKATALYFNWSQIFNGWGIHLFVGKFGAGKTSLMVAEAYELCCKYPQLHILTNINIKNFPDYTEILPLNTAQDILNAPKNTLVLIDEIGTIFNSRDFSGGKCAVPKPLFQHLCQCRKRRMMIYATVQRFNLLDKQIRDITADVTACHTHFKHPFCRIQTGYTLKNTNSMRKIRLIHLHRCTIERIYRQINAVSFMIHHSLSQICFQKSISVMKKYSPIVRA